MDVRFGNKQKLQTVPTRRPRRDFGCKEVLQSRPPVAAVVPPFEKTFLGRFAGYSRQRGAFSEGQLIYLKGLKLIVAPGPDGQELLSVVPSGVCR